MQGFIKVPSIIPTFNNGRYKMITFRNMNNNNRTNNSNIYKIKFDNYNKDKDDLIQINRTIKRIILYIAIIFLIKIYVYLENSLYLPYY